MEITNVIKLNWVADHPSEAKFFPDGKSPWRGRRMPLPPLLAVVSCTYLGVFLFASVPAWREDFRDTRCCSLLPRREVLAGINR